MKISWSFLDRESAVIGMRDEERRVAFFLYGKDEVRRVLRERADGEPDAKRLLADLDTVSIPETAAKKTVELEGTFVATLRNLLEESEDFSVGAVL